MNSSLEIKALGVALLAASISLGGVLLASMPIRVLTSPGEHAGETTSPASPTEFLSSPELIAQGRQFFTMSCVECHGDDAHGDEGPDLHNLTISNAALAVMIAKGEKNQMPAFAKKYDDAKVAALVAYLRSLH